VCLRELSVRTLVVVVEFAWVERVGTRKRIVDFRVFNLAGVESILSLYAAPQTLRIFLLIQSKCLLELSLPNVELLTV